MRLTNILWRIPQSIWCNYLGIFNVIWKPKKFALSKT